MLFKEFFYFRKSDRRALLFLLAVAAASLLVIYGPWGGAAVGGSGREESADSAKRHADRASGHSPQYVGDVPGKRAPQLFPFDPNTADSTALLRLGFSPWQVRAIYRYRAAGGIYRKPSDMTRLRSLTAGHYRQLLPYIRISEEFLPANEVFGEASATPEKDTVRFAAKMRPDEKAALNTADTTALKRVPGIGSYYARQIVSYRERLGGYVDVSQLREIEGFPMQALGYFVVDPVALRKINVNTATIYQLKRHPYINFHQARGITDYRRLKKPLESLGELRMLKDFTPSDIERLAPYVEF